MVDLQPGEVQSIDYLARAHRSGTFSAPAHIEASALDSSRTFSADVSAQVYVPGEFASSAGSDWQPPACFDLNCTAMGGAENCIPCTPARQPDWRTLRQNAVAAARSKNKE